MRNIKFRIWDSRFERWVDPKVVEINAATGLVRGSKGGDGHVDHWELMQFTGLKDKNGKDIYEGDIVKHERHVEAPSDYHTGEPAYPEGEYKRIGHVTITTSRGVTLNGRQFFNPDNLGDEKTERKYNENPTCWDFFAEVIGNIHENPELLEA